VCLVARPLCGPIVAKRCHEAILGRLFLRSLWLVGIPLLQVVGHVPSQTERFVIVPNHASWVDHAAMSFVPCDKKYLTGSKYYSLPFFGWTQWLVEDIGIDLSSAEGRRKGLADGEDLLRKGIASLVVYPEGTRQFDPPRLREFKRGAFCMAQAAKVRVLPVTLVDMWRVCGRTGLVHPGRMRVVIGEPFHVAEGPAGVDEAIRHVRDWMETQLRVA